MLTNNWYNAFVSYFSGSDSSSPDFRKITAVADGQKYNVYAYSSNVQGLFPGMQLNTATMCTSLTKTSTMIAFGDGSTPPTKDDYTLSGNLITTLSFVSKPGYLTVKGDTWSYGVNMAVKNAGSEAVTIREVGWFSSVRSAYGTNTLIMLDRTLLDEPVTIQPGETETITYKVGVTIPST